MKARFGFRLEKTQVAQFNGTRHTTAVPPRNTISWSITVLFLYIYYTLKTKAQKAIQKGSQLPTRSKKKRKTFSASD
jgi:hypothetical protein